MKVKFAVQLVLAFQVVLVISHSQAPIGSSAGHRSVAHRPCFRMPGELPQVMVSSSLLIQLISSSTLRFFAGACSTERKKKEKEKKK